jgi:Helix-turn-helix domain
MFAALSDPTWRHVFERLQSGGLWVGEIARGLPVTRPAVSQHLKVLKDAGPVSNRRNAGGLPLRQQIDAPDGWSGLFQLFAQSASQNERNAS